MKLQPLNQSKKLWLWIVIYCGMIALTLNNTYPLQGDESYYSVSASWMVTNGNYLVPHYFGEPRFQKPVLTYLIIAASYRLFGVSLWSTRVPIVIFSLLTLFLLYCFARLYIDSAEFGLFSVMLLSSSALFITFSRIAMTDLILTFFSTLALYFFALANRKKEHTALFYLLAFGATGFAFSAKGPAGFLVLPCYILYLSIIRPVDWKKHLRCFFNPLNTLLLAAICLPWYLAIWFSNSSGMISHIRSESTQFTSLPFVHIPRHLLFYAGILILFFLPFSSIAVWQYFRKKYTITKELWLPLMMGITCLVTFVFFVTASKDRYLLPAFPSLTIIIAWILFKAGPVRKLSVAATVVSTCILFILVLYPVFTGEVLRGCVYKWKREQSESLAIYNLRTLQKGMALVMAGGKCKVDSYDADYVITDQAGKDSLHQFDVVYTGFEREELRFEKKRLVVKGRNFYLLKRTTKK